MTIITSTPKSSSKDVSGAFKKVLAYNIAEIFDLTIEETMWMQRTLNESFPNLNKYASSTLPLAVKQELETRSHSKLLSQRALSESKRGSAIIKSGNQIPAREYWVMFLLSSLKESFELSPQDSLKIYELIDSILSTLGVGIKDNPRGATKIPSEMKYLLR
jgi:hypothetical protein